MGKFEGGLLPLQYKQRRYLASLDMTIILRGQQIAPSTLPEIHQRIVNPKNEVTRILLLLEELEGRLSNPPSILPEIIILTLE
ncbi:hypothetical protein [Caldisericum sp. AR60]|uniref:hypothetical protein n=1 Tax=Caldisericum sp. AR60 TaxID=3397852 RepID=UPI0039FD8702